MAKKIEIYKICQELKTDPQMMLEKSAAIEKRIDRLLHSLEEMEMIINKTNDHWQGEAAEEHKDFFYSLKPEAEENFRKMQNQVKNLREMAAVYFQAEQEVKNLSEELPSDVII